MRSTHNALWETTLIKLTILATVAGVMCLVVAAQFRPQTMTVYYTPPRYDLLVAIKYERPQWPDLGAVEPDAAEEQEAMLLDEVSEPLQEAPATVLAYTRAIKEIKKPKPVSVIAAKKKMPLLWSERTPQQMYAFGKTYAWRSCPAMRGKEVPPEQLDRVMRQLQEATSEQMVKDEIDDKCKTMPFAG